MPDATIRIRPATPEDMPAVGRLGAELVSQHHAFDPKRFITGGERVAEGYAWFLDTQLAQADVVILVAERQREVVGYVYAALEPHNWKELRDAAGFVHDVVVEASVRRLGVATQLLAAACDWLREHGAPRVLLWSAAQNAAAHALFDRLGFRRTMVEMTLEL
jgi:GNAT superfamily N-acetyltransferase